MDIRMNTRSRPVLALVGLIAWFGVFLQLWLSIRLALDSGKSLGDGLVAFFGYFTVLTNIFVALAASLPVAAGRTRLGRWFARSMVLGCATTAIVLVGIAYHFLLRNVWAPQGLQWVADKTLHYVVPFALAFYWIVFPPNQKLPVWAPLAWCAYPAIYFAYVLVRGALLGTYPYHFIDVVSLGYGKTLAHSLLLLIVFLVIGSAVAGIAKLRAPAEPALPTI